MSDTSKNNIIKDSNFVISHADGIFVKKYDEHLWSLTFYENTTILDDVEPKTIPEKILKYEIRVPISTLYAIKETIGFFEEHVEFMKENGKDIAFNSKLYDLWFEWGRKLDKTMFDTMNPFKTSDDIKKSQEYLKMILDNMKKGKCDETE